MRDEGSLKGAITQYGSIVVVHSGEAAVGCEIACRHLAFGRRIVDGYSELTLCIDGAGRLQ